MFLKSHHWVERPHNSYEIRRSMRVRESKHTVMLYDRKYMDIDTGLFDSERISTFNNQSLSDLMDSSCIYYGDTYIPGIYNLKETDNVKEFVPKDNNFDEECRLEEIKINEKREQNRIESEKYIREFEERNRLATLKREQIQSEQQRIALEIELRMVEEKIKYEDDKYRIWRENYSKRFDEHSQGVTRIITTKWGR